MADVKRILDILGYCDSIDHHCGLGLVNVARRVISKSPARPLQETKEAKVANMLDFIHIWPQICTEGIQIYDVHDLSHLVHNL